MTASTLVETIWRWLVAAAPGLAEGRGLPAVGRTLLAGLVALGLLGLVLLAGLWVEALEGHLADRRLGAGPGRRRGFRRALAGLIAHLSQPGDLTPASADRLLHGAGAPLVLGATVAAFGVLPVGAGASAVPAAVPASLVALAVLLVLQGLGMLLLAAGSGSAYPTLGALRAARTLICHGVPVALCVLVVAGLAGSLSLQGVCQEQAGHVLRWYAFRNPFAGVALIVFLVGSQALCQRAPLDLATAPEELAGGWLAELSGPRLACVQVAQRATLVLMALLGAVCFLGGWLPGLPAGDALVTGGSLPGLLVGAAVLLVKVHLVLLLQLGLAWMGPRLRQGRSGQVAIRVLLPAATLALVGSTLWHLAFPSHIWFVPESWW
jgi:NADH-quinone oxidoreductase subunit H